MKLNTIVKNMVRHIKGWEWLVLMLALVVPLLSFLYMDTNSIIRCGIDVVKSIGEGRFFGGGGFYDYALESQASGLMMHPPTYDILFYLTVGVWELPIGIIEMVTGKTLQDSAIALCYSKLLLMVFILLSAWMVYKLALQLHLSEKTGTWAAFMYLSTGYVFAYVGIAGQYDVIGIFFTLLGLYYYIREDQKKFLLFFAVAVQYKFFPLFIFIPLLLLKQKNIIKIIGNLLIVTIPVFLLQLPFSGSSPALTAKREIQADMLDRIFRNRIPIFETEVPLSLLFVGAVCLYCYCKDLKESERDYFSIFIPFLSTSMLFLSFPFFPYWIMYLAPWIPLLFFMRKDKADRRLVLEIAGGVSILLAQFSHFDWVFELNNMKGMLLDKLVFPFEKFTNPLTLSNFNTILPIEDFEYLFYGMYILCAAALIILYWPKENMENQEETFPFRKVLWLRFGIFFLIGAVPFLLYCGSILREILFS